MRGTFRLKLMDSILGRTLILVLAPVLLLTAINAGIIVLRSPPRVLAINAQEVARLLTGSAIAKPDVEVSIYEVPLRPPELAASGEDDLVAWGIARRLRVPPGDIFIQRRTVGPPGLPYYERQIEREYRLYAPDGHFNPLIFGPFTVAMELPDGRWRIVAGVPRDPVSGWQRSTLVRFIATVLLVSLIAWLFSRRLARPIRAFAAAAERMGRRQQAQPVRIGGPAEIRQAAAALNEMQERLQRYLLERTSIVGAIAHDLRTPLARLKFHLADAPEPVRAKAEREIDEMQEMIAATLEFVQSEGRPFEREPVDLALLIEGVVDDLADIGRNVSLVRAAPATVSGDPLLLKRMFLNLINNAVGYGGRADVALDVTDGRAAVDIEDEGPGLPEEEMERVFEPFYRSEGSRNRATGGLGLGLAIVRAIAQAHGGEVRFENRRQGGLRARIVLPLGG